MEAEFMSPEVTAKKNTYAGLFIVTLATLMFEIHLTRIFSVTMMYHFAFVAISIAMFGMTLGAILVYLFPNYFVQERIKYHLALCSFLFAIFIIISFLTHLIIPFAIHKSITGVYSIAFTYGMVSIPFIFSGISVCLILTKFPRQVSKLYAADLAGASVGCILLIYVLKITDGPTAVIVIALLAAIASVFFAIDAGSRKLIQITLIFSLSLLSFVIVHTILVIKQFPLLRFMWIEGGLEERPLYEKWNSFSRVTVVNDRDPKPFAWGLSPTYTSDQEVWERWLFVDTVAETTMIPFDGNFKNVEYLKYDITNLVHYIRPDSKVLVIGSGAEGIYSLHWYLTRNLF
jgi:hypothetical protein